MFAWWGCLPRYDVSAIYELMKSPQQIGLRIAVFLVATTFTLLLSNGGLRWIPNWVPLAAMGLAGAYWLLAEPSVRSVIGYFWSKGASGLVDPTTYEPLRRPRLKRPLVTILTVVIICAGIGVLSFSHRVRVEQSKESKIGNCTILSQMTEPHMSPSPDRATNQQLLRGSLAIQISLLNLQTVDYNATLKARHEKTTDKALDRQCAILQEYEKNLRIQAQMVQTAFFHRLPPEERVLSETPQIASTYAHPGDINALSVISTDLSRLDESLERSKGIKEDDDPKDDSVIVPLPRFYPTEPRNDSDYHLIQQYSAHGYMAELMSSDFFASPTAPVSGMIFLELKRDTSRRPERITVIFDKPLQSWAIGHREGQVEVGNRFVEFTTNPWDDAESVELYIRGSVRIERMTVMPLS